MNARPVSWLTDRPPQGSFPTVQPRLGSLTISGYCARGVPVDSGGGRAGFSPASLDELVFEKNEPKQTHGTREDAGLSTDEPAGVQTNRARRPVFERGELVR